MAIWNVKQGANVTITHPDLVDLNGCSVGDDTRIGPFVGIEPGSDIGARCQISSHVFICAGVIIEDDVFLGSGVTFTNRLYPRTAAEHETTSAAIEGGRSILVKREASIGSNATILAGTIIGTGALVGAGAVVTRDVPDRCLVAGVPARIIGYVDLRKKRRDAHHRARNVLIESQRRKSRSSRHH